jgi:plastocyanin
MWRFKTLLTMGIGLLAVGPLVGFLPLGRPALAATAHVTIADFSFTDSQSGTLTTTINVGDTISWTWTGAAQHSVTADDGSFDDPLNGAQTTGTFSHAFNAPGTYAYYCRVHGGPGGAGMHGVILVTAAATSTPTMMATSTDTAVPVAPTAPANTPTPSVATATTTTVTTNTTQAAPALVVGTSTQPALIAPASSGPAAGAGTLPSTGSGGAAGGGLLNGLIVVLLAVGATITAGVIAFRLGARGGQEKGTG